MSAMTVWERLAWWAMARAVRRYRDDARGSDWGPRYSAQKLMSRRMSGVFREEWPEDGDDD